MASRTRNFFLNFLSLTATALIIRGVGVAFNIYVSNKAGAEAMGLFSLLGGIYGFSVTVGCASINLGTTRAVSDALGEGNISLARKTAKKALICAFVTSAVASVLLFSLAPVLGKYTLGDTRVINPLRILAISLVPVSLCSCLAGYFTAVKRVKASSWVQIAVQGIKILLTIFFLTRLLDFGAEFACIALVLGATLSEILSLCVTYILYKHDMKVNLDADDGKKYPSIVKKLLSITVPVTFSACVRSGLTTIQHILIPKGLKASGKSWSEALSSYGILHSMVMPLVLFPSAFITSFSGLLIPEVTDCRVKGDLERLERIAYRILTFALIFSIGCAGIIIFFSQSLGTVIYSNSTSSYYIKLMAPLIPIMYIDSSVDAFLKGMGHEVYSMNVNIADALTACLFALFLIPKMGLMGYVISIYATEMLNTFLSLWKMLKITNMKFRIFHQIFMPLACIFCATNASYFLLRVMKIQGDIFDLVLHIVLSIFFYIAFLYITKTIGKDEREVIFQALKR